MRQLTRTILARPSLFGLSLVLAQALVSRTAAGQAGEPSADTAPSDVAPPSDAARAQDTPSADLPESEPTSDEEDETPAAADEASESGTGAAQNELPGDEFFEEEEEELEFEAVAEVESPPREATKRTVDEELLTRVPGTRGDALRAIEIMPGVARTEFGSNAEAPLLRGSYSSESLVLLDGASVPLMYHFGGLTSFFNSHLLEKVDLYPGNYSARYGRAAGGVVEARVRDPKTDGFHAMLELSAIDTFALAEAPLSKKTAVALAARRSNIDFFFKALVPEDTLSVLAAPVYWDYQVIVTHRFNEQNKLRVLGYGSSDHMELFLDESAPDDPALRGAANAKLQFHRAQVELDSRFSEVVEQKLMVSVGPNLSQQQLGELQGGFDLVDIQARAEWSIFAHKKLRIDTGFDFTMFAGSGDYNGPPPGQDEGVPGYGSLASEEFATVERQVIHPVRPAVYIEASYRPVEEILLVPGVRADYTADIHEWTVDPRFTGRFTVAKRTTLKTGVGLYSQPPIYYEAMDELGNPDIDPYHTLQTSLGVEQGIGESVMFDVDTFYKRWFDRIVATEGSAPPGFLNEGTGVAYGAEFLLNIRVSPKSQALLAYTLSRSERTDGPGEESRLFDYDQTHNLSLTASYDLGHGWIAGARFRYGTGNPYSPVVSAVYDANTDTYRGLTDGVNTERNPAFHQLDVRVEKLWQLGPVGLTTYLEVFNVYNAKNKSSVSYSYDYTVSEPGVGMPIFPNLGIRGEL